jgi:hypothetical protein
MYSVLLKFIYSILFFLFCSQSFGQKKKDKHFADGYIIRLGDTISCKIYNGIPKEELGYRVKFHYGDGKLITYYPGSAVKGFGILEDGDTLHFYQMDVPVYYFYGRKNDKVYVEVVASGRLTLYRFMKFKESIWTGTGLIGGALEMILASKDGNSYLIKMEGSDTLVAVGNKMAGGESYFKREEILPYVKDRPQVLAGIPVDKFIYLKELRMVLRSYNTWYKRTTIGQ